MVFGACCRSPGSFRPHQFVSNVRLVRHFTAGTRRAPIARPKFENMASLSVPVQMMAFQIVHSEKLAFAFSQIAKEFRVKLPIEPIQAEIALFRQAISPHCQLPSMLQYLNEVAKEELCTLDEDELFTLKETYGFAAQVAKGHNFSAILFQALVSKEQKIGEIIRCKNIIMSV